MTTTKAKCCQSWSTTTNYGPPRSGFRIQPGRSMAQRNGIFQQQRTYPVLHADAPFVHHTQRLSIASLVSNAGQSLAFTCPPESKNIGFGDGSEKYTAATYQYAAFADFLAREAGDGYAGWYAQQVAKTLVRDSDMRLYRMASSHISYSTQLPGRHAETRLVQRCRRSSMHHAISPY